MSGKFKTASIVVIAILLAVILIAGVTVFQREFLVSSGTSVSTTISSGQSLSSTSSQLGYGNLILRIHDPPEVPQGVTAIFVSYKDIFLGQSFGKTWIDLKQNGSINLMSVVNFTQTIANEKVPSGTFNLLVMNISSVIVTSYSTNYTASIPSEQLTAPFQGNGLTVSNSTLNGAVIDVSPTVIQHLVYNSTGAATISFVMVPSANAYVIPADQVGQNATHVGERDDSSGEQWLTGLGGAQQNQTAFKINSVILSNSSLILVLKNNGNSTVRIQTVFIESNSSTLSDENDLNIGRSVIFTVLSNGTLVPNNGGDYEGQSGIGYSLGTNSQIALSYLGSIPPSPLYSGSDSNFTSSQSSSSRNGDDAILSQQAPAISLLSFDQSAYGFQIVPGQSYLVGATSGGVTETFLVTAS
jgi:hypothetical protein